MAEDKKTLYRFDGLLWTKLFFQEHCSTSASYEFKALCPVKNCCCKIEKAKNEEFVRGEWKYKCIKCEFKITLNKSLEDKASDVAMVIEAQEYKNAEIINLDGDSIRVSSRQQVDDSDYWADVKLSKNRKGDVQLMVLAGSRKEKDKAQLFIEPNNERLSFDQNNLHPREVFAKVEAVFKSSHSKIKLIDLDDDN